MLVYYYFQKSILPNFLPVDRIHFSKAEILSNAFFYNGINPYWINHLVPGAWSITVEMTFYIFLILIVGRIKNISYAINLLNITLVLRLLFFLILRDQHFIEDKNLWEDYLYLFFPNQLPVFAAGIVLYFIIIRKEKPSINSLLGFWVLIFSSLIIGIEYFFPLHILFAFAFCLLSYILSQHAYKLFVNPIINYIGKISFSLYLVHFAVLFWLDFFELTHYTLPIQQSAF